jgi:hypothetical protein
VAHRQIPQNGHFQAVMSGRSMPNR